MVQRFLERGGQLVYLPSSCICVQAADDWSVTEVQSTWKIVEQDLENQGIIFFRRIFTTAPAALQLFSFKGPSTTRAPRPRPALEGGNKPAEEAQSTQH